MRPPTANRRLAIVLTCAMAGTCSSSWAEPVSSIGPKLHGPTGAFIQLRSVAANSAEWWKVELGAMKAIGMDTVVVVCVANNSRYYYPTRVPGGTPSEHDTLQMLLDAADQHQLKVFLGLHMDRNQFSSSAFDLAANCAQGQAELRELWIRYGRHASLAGWYMPQELNDYMVFHQPELRDDIVAYTKALTHEARASSRLPMMISPFFGRKPDAAAYAQWWDATGLPETGVDIVALQDGVGTHRTTVAEARAVFQALQPVMARHGIRFWANNESFDQIHGWPVDDKRWAAKPVGIDGFKAQVESTMPFVEKSITFEFSHYMSPQGSPAARKLYHDYQALSEAPQAANASD